MAYDIINQYLASIDAAQRQEQARVTSGAGRHAIRDVSALEKWMRNIGSEQLTEAGRRKGREAKQLKSGLGGSALYTLLFEGAKLAIKTAFPQLAVADVAWNVGRAAFAYKGYQTGAEQVPYNYRKPTAQAPQTTFAQPKYKDILGDIDRINIQGETMEARHAAAGEEMAQKLGMMLMPWGDIAGLGTSALAGGATGSYGASMGTWQGAQSASRNPLQGLYNLFGKG